MWDKSIIEIKILGFLGIQQVSGFQIFMLKQQGIIGPSSAHNYSPTPPTPPVP